MLRARVLGSGHLTSIVEIARFELQNFTVEIRNSASGESGACREGNSKRKINEKNNSRNIIEGLSTGEAFHPPRGGLVQFSCD